MAAQPGKSSGPLRRSEEDRRELAIDTMASWALEGMHPTAEALERISAVVDGSVTTDEMIATVKARFQRG